MKNDLSVFDEIELARVSGNSLTELSAALRDWYEQTRIDEIFAAAGTEFVEGISEGIFACVFGPSYCDGEKKYDPFGARLLWQPDYRRPTYRDKRPLKQVRYNQFVHTRPSRAHYREIGKTAVRRHRRARR